MGWIDFSSNGFCALKWLIEEQSITVGRTAKTQCICVRKPLDEQTLIVYHICKRYIKMNGKEILYNAFKSKDARLDGKFFVGVSSTGIYCDESGWRYRCFFADRCRHKSCA